MSKQTILSELEVLIEDCRSDLQYFDDSDDTIEFIRLQIEFIRLQNAVAVLRDVFESKSMLIQNNLKL